MMLKKRILQFDSVTRRLSNADRIHSDYPLYTKIDLNKKHLTYPNQETGSQLPEVKDLDFQIYLSYGTIPARFLLNIHHFCLKISS